MKYANLIFFITLWSHSVNAQNTKDIVIGTIDSIDSNILNEQREVWIHIPKGNSDSIFEEKKYPVVYLLDGDAHFNSVVGIMQQLSSVNGNSICPQMIVVGIPNTNRTRDLTPDKGTIHPYTDSTLIANSGGGKNFMSFIEKELIPYINSKYPTRPYQMLIGHSFGGLTVMNTFIHKPYLFNSYISIDPSMWWNDKKLLNEIEQLNMDEKYADKKLYLGIANTMEPEMNLQSVLKDTTFETEHIRSILKLNDILNNESQNVLSFKSKYYKNDDHGSVPLITTYDAFRYIFETYQLKISGQDYFDPDSDILNKIVNHYEKLSKEFDMEIKPDERNINSLGLQFLEMKQLKKSEQLFKLNVTNYPKSFNTYDSLGDLYIAKEEKEKAIENYKKSILLNENSVSKSKLNNLGKE